MLGDLNARVGNDVIEVVMGQYGVSRRNDSGRRLLCRAGVSSWFRKNYAYKFTFCENFRIKSGIQSIDGLCVGTYTN